jgi:hypothetical protein
MQHEAEFTSFCCSWHDRPKSGWVSWTSQGCTFHQPSGSSRCAPGRNYIGCHLRAHDSAKPFLKKKGEGQAVRRGTNFLRKAIGKLTAFLQLQEFSWRNLPTSGQFYYRRAAFSSQPKSKVGNFHVKDAVLQISLDVITDSTQQYTGLFIINR